MVYLTKKFTKNSNTDRWINCAYRIVWIEDSFPILVQAGEDVADVVGEEALVVEHDGGHLRHRRRLHLLVVVVAVRLHPHLGNLKKALLRVRDPVGFFTPWSGKEKNHPGKLSRIIVFGGKMLKFFLNSVMRIRFRDGKIQIRDREWKIQIRIRILI